MIDFKLGNFDWNLGLINPATGRPRIALVFCWSSGCMNKWADVLTPDHGIVFRNFGENRSATEAVADFGHLTRAVTVAPPPVPIILTTHRVELMSNDVSRPDCIFILRDGDFVARPIWTLADKEIRFAHNLQKMWLGGMFD